MEKLHKCSKCGYNACKIENTADWIYEDEEDHVAENLYEYDEYKCPECDNTEIVGEKKLLRSEW